MTGILKKHRATYACEGVRLWYDTYNNRGIRNATGAYRHGIRCPKIIALDGSEWNYIYGSRGYAGSYANDAEIAGYNESSFNGLTAFATADTLDTWSIDDHTISSIGSTTQGRACMFNDQIMQQTYTINIANNSDEDIVVKCIRFSRNVCLCTDTQYDSGSSTPQYSEKTCLAYSYYLDEPITISPGNTHTLTVKFSPTED